MSTPSSASALSSASFRGPDTSASRTSHRCDDPVRTLSPFHVTATATLDPPAEEGSIIVVAIALAPVSRMRGAVAAVVVVGPSPSDAASTSWPFRMGTPTTLPAVVPPPPTICRPSAAPASSPSPVCKWKKATPSRTSCSSGSPRRRSSSVMSVPTASGPRGTTRWPHADCGFGLAGCCSVAAAAVAAAAANRA